MTCLNCGEKEALKYFGRGVDHEYFTKNEGYDYFQCEKCSCVSIEKTLVEELPQIYPSNYYSFNTGSLGFANKVKLLLDKIFFKKVLSNVSSDSVNVLDVGGGTGWLLDLIKSCDSRVSTTAVVDIDENSQDTAIKNGHKYYLSTFENAEVEEKFDLIIMLNIIEHVEAPRLMIEKAKSLLKDGGRVILKTPNIDSLDGRIFKDHNWGGFHCPRHWILYDKDSLSKMVTDHGLSIDTIKYTQGASFWATSVMSFMYKRGLISIDKDHPMHLHPLFRFLIMGFASFDLLRGFFSKTSQIFLVARKDS